MHQKGDKTRLDLKSKPLKIKILIKNATQTNEAHEQHITRQFLNQCCCLVEKYPLAYITLSSFEFSVHRTPKNFAFATSPGCDSK